jgi:hypothetical protein
LTVTNKYIEELSIRAYEESQKPAFRYKSTKLIGKALGSILKQNQVTDYMEDAVALSVVNCIKRYTDDEDASKVLLEGGVGAMQVYLLVILANICRDQLKTWRSVDYAVRDNRTSPPASPLDKPQKRVAARLRTELDGLKSSLIAENLVFNAIGGREIDTQIDVENILLKIDKIGLSDDIKFYMQEYLTGVTFEEMRIAYGGSSCKYRKLVKRALEKIAN